MPTKEQALSSHKDTLPNYWVYRFILELQEIISHEKQLKEKGLTSVLPEDPLLTTLVISRQMAEFKLRREWPLSRMLLWEFLIVCLNLGYFKIEIKKKILLLSS